MDSIAATVPDALDHIPRPVPAETARTVALSPGSLLQRRAGCPEVRLSSLHRQAIAGTGDFIVAARAPDGVIEAIEADGQTFAVGVQWHPEYQLTPLDGALLAAFVKASRAAWPPAQEMPIPVAERLAHPALTLPKASPPPGPFVGAIRWGNTITVSGQPPLLDGKAMMAGRLGERSRWNRDGIARVRRF